MSPWLSSDSHPAWHIPGVSEGCSHYCYCCINCGQWTLPSAGLHLSDEFTQWAMKLWGSLNDTIAGAPPNVIRARAKLLEGTCYIFIHRLISYLMSWSSSQWRITTVHTTFLPCMTVGHEVMFTEAGQVYPPPLPQSLASVRRSLLLRNFWGQVITENRISLSHGPGSLLARPQTPKARRRTMAARWCPRISASRVEAKWAS